MQLIGLFVGEGWRVNTLHALTIFETANTVLQERRYVSRMLSHEGGILKTAHGVQLVTQPLMSSQLDTLFVTRACVSALRRPGLLDCLFEACWVARRMASSSEGTEALAELGILDGRRVAVDPAKAPEFEKRFPTVDTWSGSAIARDGPVHTSARETDGVDLALMLLERDIGRIRTQEVAARALIHHCRSSVRTNGSRHPVCGIDLKAGTQRAISAVLGGQRW